MSLIRFELLALILLTALIVSNCGDEEADSEEITKSLADRLTEALDFDGSDVVAELPPPVGEAAQEAQISGMVVQDYLVSGEPFTVEITTSWPNPEEIGMAVVWVKDASKHIWVHHDIYPEGASFTTDLGGVLKEVPDLVGMTFTVSIGLQIRNETAGDYVDWEFTIRE